MSRSELLVATVVVVALVGFSAYGLVSFFECSYVHQREGLFALSIEGTVLAVLFFIHGGMRGYYLFEPYTMVFSVYSLLFFFAPTVQFSQGNISRYGVDASSTAMLGTTVATFGFAMFQIGYDIILNPSKLQIGIKCEGRFGSAIKEDKTRISVLRIAFAIWGASYLLCFYNYIRQGFTPSYIVTAGFSGSINEDIALSDLGFLSYFKYTLVPCWLIYFAYGKNKLIKIAGFVLSLGMLMFGGSRSSILLLVIAPIAFYFMRKGKTPSIRLVLAGLLVLFIAFAFIQVARHGVKTGSGFDVANKDAMAFITPFLNEIEAYKLYYQLFTAIPSRVDFLYGSQMFGYTLIMLIPRALWPGKPDAAIHQITYLAGGSEALSRGNAYPALGEFYVEFGIVGCLIGMYLVGLMCRSLMGLYASDSSNELTLMAYSVIFPAMFQLMIRGYFPSNCMMLLFLLFPIAFIALYVNGLSRKRKTELNFKIEETEKGL